MRKFTTEIMATLIALLFSVQAFAQCQAGFQVWTVNGLEITFNNESIDNATNTLPDVAWDFGDGAGTSTDYDAVYTFPAAGTYGVCVTATTAVCTDTFCQDVTVGTVSCESFVIEVSNNVNGVVGIAGSIYNQTDFGPYEPDAVEWYIEGLGVMIANTPTFSTTFPPNVDPALNWTICASYEIDGIACPDSLCVPLNPPTSNCNNFFMDVEVNGGLEVSGGVYNNAGNTPIVAEWYVQELPNYVLANTPTFTINLPATTFPVQDNYTICVDFEDDGDVCTLCDVYTIGAGNCAYALSTNINGMEVCGELLLAPDAIPFDTVTYILEGGGGVIGTGNDFCYMFNAPGTYEICALYEVNGVCDGFVCETITIIDPNNNPCEYEINVSVNSDWTAVMELNGLNGSPQPNSIEWIIDGGTGQIGTGSPLTYQFNAAGIYTVCVEYAIPGTTCFGTICQDVVVGGNQNCDFSIGYTINNGMFEGEFYSINNLPLPDVTTWIIQELGLVIGNGTTVNYPFISEGTYTICAEYAPNNVNSCDGQICESVVVELDVCVVDFDYSINNDLSAAFEVVPMGPPFSETFPDNPQWFINGVNVGTGSPLTYQFPMAGTYNVCLLVDIIDISGNVVCQAESCQEISTEPECMDLEFASNLNGQIGTFELIQTPANVLEWVNPVWSVDGDSIDSFNVFEYEFPGAGVYEVCLTADLVDLGLNYICTQEVCETIEIQGGSNLCEAYFEWSEIPNTSYGVVFENLSDGNYDAVWQFGDGQLEVSNSGSIDHLYDNPGVYTVCLTVADPIIGCQDSYCENIFVSGQPNCNFAISYTLSGNTGEFAISDGAGNFPPVTEWYNGIDNTSYGNGNDITITFPGTGTYEICADYEISGTTCLGTICETVTINDPNCNNTDCVFPGDADYDFVANNFDVLPIGLEFGATGPARPNASTAWYGQFAPDWSNTTTGGVNLKHVDCDGNGEIGFDDIDVIQLNYNRTHDGIMPTNFIETPEIWLDFDLDTILIDAMMGNTIIVEADIMVATDNMPAEDVYGLAFSINYPAALVEEGSVQAAYFNDSWLGDGSTVLQLEQDIYDEGVIDFGYSRTDMQNVSGFGKIGTVSFVMTDNIIGALGRSSEPEELWLNFYITDIKVIGNTGEELSFSGSHGDVLLTGETTDVLNPTLNEVINVYPNPASSTINVLAEDVQIEKVLLYNAVGQLIQQNNTANSYQQFDASELPGGLYLVSIHTDEGILNVKVVVE